MLSHLYQRFDQIDTLLTTWMARNGVKLLRLSLGIVFFWFGVLKFFPGISPAESLAGETIALLSFGLVPAKAAVWILAVWETLIGLGLLSGRFLRETLLLLWVQMLGTLTPLFLFPGETFIVFPVVPTLEGQYIIKNLVLISAGIVIGATVRGGGLIPEPPDKALRLHHPLGKHIVTVAIWWIRRDLRLEDNPALAAAPARGHSVIPCFVLDSHLIGHPNTGPQRRDK